MFNYKEYLKTRKEIEKDLMNDYFVRKYAASSHQNMTTKPEPNYSEEEKAKFYDFWFNIIKKDNIVKVIALIKSGFKKNILDINKTDNDGNSGLILACKYNNEEIVNDILELPDVNPNIQNKDGETALIVTIKWNIIKKLLVIPSIDLYLKDNNNKTFFDYYASKDSKYELKNMLSSYTLQKTIADNNINNIFIFVDHNILNPKLIPELVAKNQDYKDIFKDTYVGFDRPKRKPKEQEYFIADDEDL